MDVRLLRHRLPKRLGRLTGERRQVEPGVADRVGRHHARAAGVGDDRDAVGVGQRLAAENTGGVEQLVDRLRADDAGLIESRLVRLLGTGERAGV